MRALLFTLLLSFLAESCLGQSRCTGVFTQSPSGFSVNQLQEITDNRLRQAFRLRTNDSDKIPLQSEFYKEAKFKVAVDPVEPVPANAQVFRNVEFGYITGTDGGYRRLGTLNYLVLSTEGKVVEVGAGSRQLIIEARSHIFGRVLSPEELQTISTINKKLITQLRNHPEAQKKLKEFARKRQWPEGLEDKAQLAYYSESILSIPRWAQENGYSLFQMRDAGWGLIKFNQSGQPIFDFPKEESIKIPYFSDADQSGIPIWRTRNIQKRDDGKKYIGWQMDRSIDRTYTANETLYNGWMLSKAQGKTIVITEGEFKCLVAQEATGILTLGIPGITQFSTDLAKAIAQASPKEVIVVLDRDPRGKGLMRSDGITDSQRAAYSIAQQLVAAGTKNVKVGILPDVFDGGKVGIDDLILARGTEPYLQTLAQATSPADYARKISLDPELNRLQARHQALSKAWENYLKSVRRGGNALAEAAALQAQAEVQKARKEYFDYLASRYKGATSLNQTSKEYPSIFGHQNEILVMDFVPKEVSREFCKPGPCSPLDFTQQELTQFINGRTTTERLAKIFEKGQQAAAENGFNPQNMADRSTVFLAGLLRHDFPAEEYKMEFNVKVQSSLQQGVSEIVPLVIRRLSKDSVVAIGRLRPTLNSNFNDAQNHLFTRIGNYLRPENIKKDSAEPIYRPAVPNVDTQALTLRDLNSVKQLTVMTLNPRDLNKEKSESEIQMITEVIRKSDSDIIILQETNLESLQHLANTQLNAKWKAYLVEGNDSRRHIGFLVKSDLPLDISLESHSKTLWKVSHLFSRDVPALILKRKGDDKPALIVLGAHAHSNGGFNNKNFAELKKAETNGMAQIIRKYKNQYGEDVPMFLGGDFNTKVRPDGDMNPIYKEMKESFDVLNLPFSKRFTHYFMGEEGVRILRQIDAIFTTPSLAPSIKQAFVYPYLHPQRPALLPADTPPQFITDNPSDHYAVVVVISTEKIFPEAH